MKKTDIFNHDQNITIEVKLFGICNKTINQNLKDYFILITKES